MEILIAGCGIGGLSAGIALARIGHSVTIVEQAPELKPIGAGISLQPNALQALAKLQIHQPIIDRGFTTPVAIVRLSTGRIVQKMDFVPWKSQFQFLPLTIHRAALLEQLYLVAKDLGVTVRFGQPIVDANSDDQSCWIVTEDGERISGKLLVGADGINSVIRAQLFGSAEPDYAGYVCWRGIVDEAQLVNQVDTMNEVWGKAARFGFMRCSETQVYWFATKNAKTIKQVPVDWYRDFDGWPRPIRSLIDATPVENIHFNPIADRKPIFPWSRKNAVLLGDAAHPTTPNFGQGGAQAIEDAVILARALECHKDIKPAINAFESHRHPRTSGLVNGARSYGKVAQGGNGFYRVIRNHLLSRLPQKMVDKQLRMQLDFESHYESFHPAKNSGD